MQTWAEGAVTLLLAPLLFSVDCGFEASALTFVFRMMFPLSPRSQFSCFIFPFPSVSLHRLWSHLQKQRRPRYQVQRPYKRDGDYPDKHNVCEFTLLCHCKASQSGLSRMVASPFPHVCLIFTRWISMWPSIPCRPIWNTCSSLTMWSR